MQNPKEEIGTSSPANLWLPPAGIALLIMVLSSIPGKSFPAHPDSLNSLAHFCEFAVFSYLMARALFLSSTTKNLAGLTMICLGVGVIFGATTEVFQFAIPHRLFDPVDILVDSVGTLAGTLVFWGRAKTAGT